MEIKSAKNIANDNKLKIMVHGASGTGKTRLISTITEPTLVMNADKGLMSINGSDVDFATVNNWTEAEEFMKYIRTKECQERYKFIVFDSVTALVQLLTLHLTNVKKLEGFEFWNVYKSFVNEFLTFLRDQNVYDILTIFESIPKEDASGMPYKSYGISGSAANSIPGYFDEVFYLKVDKEGNRILQTAGSMGIEAKDRSQKLEKSEPADLNNVLNKIRGNNVNKRNDRNTK